MECRASPIRTLGLLALDALLLAASAVCLLRDEPLAQLAGLAGLLLFGFAGLLLLTKGFRRAPVVVIDERGIEDRRLGCGVIPWAEIRSIHVRELRSSRFLGLELVDEERYLARLSRWRRVLARGNRKLGFAAFSIGFTGLKPGLDEVLAHLESHRSAPS